MSATEKMKSMREVAAISEASWQSQFLLPEAHWLNHDLDNIGRQAMVAGLRMFASQCLSVAFKEVAPDFHFAFEFGASDPGLVAVDALLPDRLVVGARSSFLSVKIDWSPEEMTLQRTRLSEKVVVPLTHEETGPMLTKALLDIAAAFARQLPPSARFGPF